MIYDTFPLGYETDVLLLRLQTLSDVVDRFCIVEGDRTFTGQPRGWLWPQLADRLEFAPFLDRVWWTPVTLTADEPWQREHELRGHMLRLVDDVGAQPDDGVIISDADEIPNPEAVRRWLNGTQGLQRLAGYYHQLKLDLRAAGSLQGPMKDHPSLDGHLWEFRQPLIGQRRAFRHAQEDRTRLQVAARPCDDDVHGWHFTCQGTPEDVAAKLRAFSHVELAHKSADNVRQHLQTRRTIGHDVRLHRVPLSALPFPVQKDPERWAGLL